MEKMTCLNWKSDLQRRSSARDLRERDNRLNGTSGVKL